MSTVNTNNLQKFNTWNTLIPIYTKWKKEADADNNTFFVDYYDRKVQDAINSRQDAYDKLPKSIKETLIFN